MNADTNKQAFTRLIQENKRIIFKICNSYCRKKEERDDLAQEIVYELWKSWQHFNPDFRFTTWMYRIALNVAISFYRKEKKAGQLFALDENLLECEDDSGIDEANENNFSLMHRFISELKEIDRSIVILYLDDKSYKEISEIIGLTETNVATRISRIKETLRNKFSHHQKISKWN